MREVARPREAVLASLRRGSRLKVPRGDTVLEPGDVLIAVTEDAARAELERLCGGGECWPRPAAVL